MRMFVLRNSIPGERSPHVEGVSTSAAAVYVKHPKVFQTARVLAVNSKPQSSQQPHTRTVNYSNLFWHSLAATHTHKLNSQRFQRLEIKLSRHCLPPFFEPYSPDPAATGQAVSSLRPPVSCLIAHDSASAIAATNDRSCCVIGPDRVDSAARPTSCRHARQQRH